MKKLFLIMLCLSHSILSPDHLRDFCLEIIETIEMPDVVDKILSQSTNSEDEVTLRLGLCLSDMLAHQDLSNKKLGTDVEIQQLHEQLDEEIIAFLDQTEILYGLHNASDLTYNQILQKLALRSTCTFFNVTPLASAVNASISGGSNNVAIGFNAGANTTSGDFGIAIGGCALASAQDTIALGDTASSTFQNALAIGLNSIVTGTDALAIGNAAAASQAGAIAIGSLDSIGAAASGVTASGRNAVAIGSAFNGNAGASATGMGTIALGGSDGITAGASASMLRSVALGVGSSTAVSDSIVLGNPTSSAVAVTIGTNMPATSRLTIVPSGSQNAVAASNGSAALPAYSFIGNSSTGIYSSGTNQLSFTTNGISRLTIDSGGNMNIPGGNFTLPVATAGALITTSSGLLALGGMNPSASNVTFFEVGTRNLFAGNYSAIPNIGTGGIENIAIGTNALAAITTGTANIAIGMNALALISAGTGNVAIGPNAANTNSTDRNFVAIGNTPLASSDSVVIGHAATAFGFPRSIVLGSIDSTNAIGAGPMTGAVNAIAIGSANGAFPGAAATGLASIAIGGSDGALNGASASAQDAIAIGAGASVNGTNSVALGANTTVAQSNAIVLGSVGTSAVSVGIGTNTPSAKLTVVGTGAGGVTPLRLLTPPTSLSTDSLVTIDGSGNIRQSTATGTFGNVIFNGGQAGPLTIGTTNVATLAFITNNVNRLTIDQTGNSTFTGNIKLPAATPNVSTANATGATSGLLEFGGANPSSTNISMFKIGTRNIFGGNYATTPNVAASATDNFARGTNSLAALTTGTGNIAIGWNANSLLTTGSNTIAIGNSASAAFHNAIAIGLNSVVTGTDALAFGNNAIASQARAIAIGSQDSIGILANAAIASAQNAIAIGGSFNGKTGAAAAGVASIAFGAADGTNVGANTGAAAKDSIAIGVGSSLTQPFGVAVGALATLSTGTDSIAIGHSANSSQNRTIVIGSTDSTSTGAAPIATGSNSIAIGSAAGAFAGATVAGGRSSIAIGAADAIVSTTVGATVTSIADNAIAIGTGTIAAQDNTIVLGLMATATVNDNAIAIGSASIGPFFAGPSAAGIASIALGSADGIATAGPVATGARSVALGTGSVATRADSIVLGNAINPSVGVTIGTNIPSTTFTTTARLTIVTSGDQNAIATSNGTLSAPAYSFIGTNTSVGMYSPGPNELALVASGTARLLIDSTQSVSIFSKYKAHAYRATSNQTVSGTTATVVFNSTASPGFDPNGNFNTATGLYTAPMSGFYFVTAHLSVVVGSAATSKTIDMIKNGTALTAYSSSNNFAAAIEGAMHTTGIVQLSQGDTIGVQYTTPAGSDNIQFGSTASAANSPTHMSIHFLSF